MQDSPGGGLNEFQLKVQKTAGEHPSANPEKVLINLNKCEKLFQEDKSEKQKYEIEQIKRSIEERQALESDFYYSLNLDDWSKKKVFGFNVREKQRPKEFVFVQDPVLGNIIKRTGN